MASTVTGNVSRPHGEYVGQAMGSYGGTLNLFDTIVWGNLQIPATGGPDLIVGALSTVNLAYSDIGSMQSVTGGGGVLNDLGGNVSVDPQLISYRLAGGSPLVDAGTCVGVPSIDIDGDPRPTGASCDIGADEFVP